MYTHRHSSEILVMGIGSIHEGMQRIGFVYSSAPANTNGCEQLMLQYCSLVDNEFKGHSCDRLVFQMVGVMFK